jgi:hypothetical protein
LSVFNNLHVLKAPAATTLHPPAKVVMAQRGRKD